ncbi:hypothetical protein O6H91_15G026700 [Diphasiastrum complanatum]|uniref:Uncharacterized protein n=1 Tax=Diphasiastrum complanatum TaxID=34168 RepID=A0ACC2BGW1_DIPCM|nr:hypothetical protein O6H91_15G026700 [Diphasiastrum complanatum]
MRAGGCAPPCFLCLLVLSLLRVVASLFAQLVLRFLLVCCLLFVVLRSVSSRCDSAGGCGSSGFVLLLCLIRVGVVDSSLVFWLQPGVCSPGFGEPSSFRLAPGVYFFPVMASDKVSVFSST